MQALIKILPFFALLLLAAQVNATEGAMPPVAGVYSYYNAQRTSISSFIHGGWTFGPVISERSTRRAVSYGAEYIGNEVFDCSDEKYLCITTGVTIAAVPREPLLKSMRYSVEGSEFTVEKCIREEDQVCQTALITAYCHSFRIELDKRTCLPRTAEARDGDFQGGSFLYFIYNEDYGVTSFGFAESPLEGASRSEADIDLIAREYILQGDIGLLKP